MNFNFGELAKEIEILVETLKSEEGFNERVSLLCMLREMVLEQIENENINNSAR